MGGRALLTVGKYASEKYRGAHHMSPVKGEEKRKGGKRAGNEKSRVYSRAKKLRIPPHAACASLVAERVTRVLRANEKVRRPGNGAKRAKDSGQRMPVMRSWHAPTEVAS